MFWVYPVFVIVVRHGSWVLPEWSGRLSMVKKKGSQRSTPESSPEIVGATLVAALAGEMIGELTLAITNKLTMQALAEIVHCYPTQAEVFERIALIRMLLLETNEFVERGHVEPQFAQLLRRSELTGTAPGHGGGPLVST